MTLSPRRHWGVSTSRPETASLMNDRRAFSDLLLEAAGRVEEIPPDELGRLLYKAAVRLRVVQVVGVRLEHIPVSAYHLLRRLAEQPLSLRALTGREVKAAVAFLTSRGLAAADGTQHYARWTRDRRDC